MRAADRSGGNPEPSPSNRTQPARSCSRLRPDTRVFISADFLQRFPRDVLTVWPALEAALFTLARGSNPRCRCLVFHVRPLWCCSLKLFYGERKTGSIQRTHDVGFFERQTATKDFFFIFVLNIYQCNQWRASPLFGSVLEKQVLNMLLLSTLV